MSQQIREQIAQLEQQQAQLEQQQAELQAKLKQTEREEELEEKLSAQKQKHQELKTTYQSSLAEKLPQVISAIADLEKLVQAQLIPATAYKNFVESDENSTYFDQLKCMNEEEHSRLDGFATLFEQINIRLGAMQNELGTF